MTQYWFRRRRGLFTKDLGWGWVPTSWEGWVVIGATLAIVVGTFFAFDLTNGSYGRGLGFLLSLIVIIMISGRVSEWKTKP